MKDLTRLRRIAILGLSKAVRKSREAGQAERLDPFLHLDLHISTPPQSLRWFRFLLKHDLWQVE